MSWYTGPNADLVAEARTWLGVRWKHQGRDRSGVDCLGMVQQVAKTCRGFDVDRTNYPRRGQGAAFLAELRVHLLEIDRADIEPGDLICMPYDGDLHVALVADYPLEPEKRLLSMIHAHARVQDRKVVEHRLDSVWMSKVSAAFRYPGGACLN